MLPDAQSLQSEALWDCTLEELGMCPRAVVFASIYSAHEREALLERNSSRETEKTVAQVAKVQSEKRYVFSESSAMSYFPPNVSLYRGCL